MTTYFISRHSGAVEWARQEGYQIEQQHPHLDLAVIQPGDIVLGTLPINLVAELNALGGRYFHLTLDIPADKRGKELSADDMRQYKAHLQEFRAKKCTLPGSTDTG